MYRLNESSSVLCSFLDDDERPMCLNRDGTITKCVRCSNITRFMSTGFAGRALTQGFPQMVVSCYLHSDSAKSSLARMCGVTNYLASKGFTVSGCTRDDVRISNSRLVSLMNLGETQEVSHEVLVIGRRLTISELDSLSLDCYFKYYELRGDLRLDHYPQMVLTSQGHKIWKDNLDFEVIDIPVYDLVDELKTGGYSIEFELDGGVMSRTESVDNDSSVVGSENQEWRQLEESGYLSDFEQQDIYSRFTLECPEVRGCVSGSPTTSEINNLTSEMVDVFQQADY